jgi:large subunit ribosomal protein L17
MRHQVRGRKLGRTSSHRLATMRALSSALIKNQRIVTTVAKAKELRRYIEPVITRARKDDSTSSRRQIFKFLNDKETIKTLFEDIIPEISDRPGGYTRIIKLGERSGDGAPMAMIELVDFNDVKPEGKETKKKRTRRAGRKKATTSATAPAAAKKEQPDAVETKAEKEPEVAETAVETATEEPKAEAAVETATEVKADAPAKAATEETASEEKEADKPAAEAKEETKKTEKKAEKVKAEKAETAEEPAAEKDEKDESAESDKKK